MSGRYTVRYSERYSEAVRRAVGHTVRDTVRYTVRHTVRHLYSTHGSTSYELISVHFGSINTTIGAESFGVSAAIVAVYASSICISEIK